MRLRILFRFLVVGALVLGACDDSDAPASSDARADVTAPTDSEAAADSDAPADAAAGEIDPALAATLDGVITAQSEAAVAPGAAAGVVLADGARWLGATGDAVRDPQRAALPTDRFRVGSLTKTFVAALTLLLVDEGVLTLDDSLDRWVTGFELPPGITLRNLLDHTSGVFNFLEDPSVLGRIGEATTPTEVVTLALAHDPEFVAGTDWKYSNTNYILLALAIESATGRPLHELLRERLFEPLGLDDTWLEAAEPAPSGEFVAGYLSGQDPPPFSATWAWAAGALISSVGDLLTWARALYLGDLLPADLRATMIELQPLSDGKEDFGYGLGCHLGTLEDRALIGHTGSTMGGSARMFCDREAQQCVVVLTNDFFGKPGAIGDALWKALPR